jgi:hypothetical protein
VKKDNFDQWMSSGQGKLLTEKIKVQKQNLNQGKVSGVKVAP